MTVQECYAAIGGDYADVVSRLRTDERIAKFLFRILDDKNMELLCKCVEEKNLQEAFRAAHTLKGICMNLSLSRLNSSVSDMTELLRGRTEFGSDIVALLEKVKEDYAVTMDSIYLLRQASHI